MQRSFKSTEKKQSSDACACLVKYLKFFIMIRKVKNEDRTLMMYIQFPPTAFGPFFPLSVELKGYNGVNTVNRQLEGFNEEKGGLFGCILAAVLAYSGTGNGVTMGAVGLGFLVNVPLFTSRVG